MTTTDQIGTVEIAGKRVPQLGFRTMRLTGRSIWGRPTDRNECIAVLSRAVKLGVQYIDTATPTAPNIAEDSVRSALHPNDVVTSLVGEPQRTAISLPRPDGLQHPGDPHT